MMFNGKKVLFIAALASLISSRSVKAAPEVTLMVEASTSGTQGTYSSTLATAPATGSTLYFEVFALSAPSGTVNSNSTTKKPDGANDSIITLPNITLTVSSDSTFATSTLQNNFGTAASANKGTTGGSTLDFRAGETGFVENDDTLLGIISGTVTVGASFTAITAATDIPVVNAGSLKLGGVNTPVTATSESGNDPYLVYTALTEPSAPEPASLSLLGLAGLALMRRRRTTGSALTSA